MKNLTTFVAITALTTCILATAPANASPESRSETVRFSDLNMTDSKASAVLYDRLEIAAKNVCRDLDNRGSLSAREQYYKCVRVVLGNVVVRLDLARLNTYAAARGVRIPETITVARGN
jgi:UrcA family protein